MRSSRAPAEFSELRSGSRSGRKIGVALRPALRPSGARAPGCAPTKVKIMNTHCSIKSGSTVYYYKEAQIMTQLFKTIVSSNSGSFLARKFKPIVDSISIVWKTANSWRIHFENQCILANFQ